MYQIVFDFPLFFFVPPPLVHLIFLTYPLGIGPLVYQIHLIIYLILPRPRPNLHPGQILGIVLMQPGFLGIILYLLIFLLLLRCYIFHPLMSQYFYLFHFLRYHWPHHPHPQVFPQHLLQSQFQPFSLMVPCYQKFQNTGYEHYL